MPGMQQKQHENPKVRPYDGTVTVHLSDAIIASTRNALVVEEGDKEPAFFIPFKDIYFEFLGEEHEHETVPGRGIRRTWNGEAVGMAAKAVMWSYEEPEGAFVRVLEHGTFDPHKADIDANPAEDRAHTPHMP